MNELFTAKPHWKTNNPKFELDTLFSGTIQFKKIHIYEVMIDDDNIYFSIIFGLENKNKSNQCEDHFGDGLFIKNSDIVSDLFDVIGLIKDYWKKEYSDFYKDNVYFKTFDIDNMNWLDIQMLEKFFKCTSLNSIIQNNFRIV